MRTKIYLASVLLGLLITGCQKESCDDKVVSTNYIHKYGYSVSKEEWESKGYPGQVITNLENGITITASYEGKKLHGPSSQTYPHSQIVEKYFLYDDGKLTKEISYDTKGIPTKEIVYLSPARNCITLWYADGSPRSIEEYVNKELVEGQYFTTTNETESRVIKGNGNRIVRNNDGVLVSKEDFVNGLCTKLETFYSSGSPETVATYHDGKLHGVRNAYSEIGEPLSCEEWIDGQLHGKATQFKNGAKYLETYYLFGAKNGFETYFIDGEVISQRVLWENDKQHGQATYYVSGTPHTRWFYEGKEVSQKEFESLDHMDEIISQISPEARSE